MYISVSCEKDLMHVCQGFSGTPPTHGFAESDRFLTYRLRKEYDRLPFTARAPTKGKCGRPGERSSPGRHSFERIAQDRKTSPTRPDNCFAPAEAALGPPIGLVGLAAYVRVRRSGAGHRVEELR